MNIERIILGAIAAILLIITVTVAYTVHSIEKTGGVKAAIIEAGKEFKDINKQISQ